MRNVLSILLILLAFNDHVFGRETFFSVGKYGLKTKRQIETFVKARAGKIKIHPGKQGKHIPGHNNFKPGKSEFTHKNPEKLIKDHGGKGKWHGDTKEVVDFKEPIGVHVSPEGIRTPTTRGTIHYDNSGNAHIVPARPIGD